MFKKNALGVSITYTVLLIAVSLAKLDLESVEEIVPSYSDKIFHFLAYALFTWLWFNSFYFKFNFSKIKSVFRSILVSVTFGIIIEVLQLILTASRSFDIFDIIANSLGVLFAVILIQTKINRDVKKY
ncbi:MAG TPA: VanZ family protein [Xanthomarina sp.]|nr:VanZ family protein [Xanthomarina sp.]